MSFTRRTSAWQPLPLKLCHNVIPSPAGRQGEACSFGRLSSASSGSPRSLRNPSRPCQKLRQHDFAQFADPLRPSPTSRSSRSLPLTGQASSLDKLPSILRLRSGQAKLRAGGRTIRFTKGRGPKPDYSEQKTGTSIKL
jgi:hypothetical protein